jgi:hypothetical protein
MRKKKAVKPLNTKILKKLSAKVQFRKTKDGYVVERKSLDTGEWDIIGRSSKIERALMRKHNAWYAELSRLNYTARLMNNRKFRKMKLERIRKKELAKSKN